MDTQSKHRLASRRSFLRFCATGSGLALTGCGPLSGLFPSSTPTPGSLFVEQQPTVLATAAAAKPSGKTSIKLNAPNNSIRPLLENFERDNPEIAVQYVTQNPRDAFQELRNALKYGDNVPDVAIVTPDMIGDLATFNSLADLSLPPFEASSFEKDIVENAWNAGKLQGKRIALPWAVLPLAMLYRIDMLKEAGIDGEPTTLEQRLKSWDDMLLLAQEFKQKQPTKAFFGEAASVFASMVAQQGYGWLDGRKVLIEELGSTPAKMAARVQALKLALQTGTGGGWNFGQSIRKKEFAAFLGPMTLIGIISGNLPETAELWRTLRLPGGDAILGGLFLVIPARAAYPELAWKFVRYLLTNVEAQTDWLASQGLVPTYKPGLETPLINQGLPFLGGQQIYKLAVDIVAHMPGMRFSAYDRDASDIVDKQLTQVLELNKDPQKAMRDAEKELLQKASDLVA